jgi:hypothetical protein
LQKEQRPSMADQPETSEHKPPTNPDEIALELMKFIAVTTGYGKGAGATGFGSKGGRSGEEYADSLFELFARCRSAVRKNP